MSTVKGPMAYVPVDPAYLARLEAVAAFASVLTLAVGPECAPGRVSVSRRAVEELARALRELVTAVESSPDARVRS